jgi:NTP pyrophosphatase (non-canonical NTP hydrolase)
MEDVSEYGVNVKSLQGDRILASLMEIQEMMQRLYFHSDSRRGVERTFSWLKEEINELGEAMGVRIGRR